MVTLFVSWLQSSTENVEMAALCPGVKYGLSSQQNFGENKDLIFVKLTDSALRAIEEHLKNQSKFSNTTPTIKFLGNGGGQLSFPSLNGLTQFNFSMSGTSDIEGPGGSFECVQQSGPPRGSLEVLGTIPHKIRIHANEDVYDMTRHRMTVAEENNRNKCTREIKMNQNDIGRKVKVRQAQGRSAVPPSRRDISSLRDSLSKPSYQPIVPSKSVVHSSNGVSNGLGSNHVSSSRPQNKPSLPDIAKRPIKERLIHLLALRPFKKPELFERLQREGLRERNSMTSVLKQIASLRDNCYHLNRAMWNDVNEDWPFYTDSEREVLKRRKPQNLTPPGGSDGGSSGSGQSPTSTHPGSPPSVISSSKRPGYYDGADGLPTKRPRISHFRKPSEQTYRSPVENNSQRRPMTDSRDASNMNPRSRESPPNGYANSMSNGYGMTLDKRMLSDEEDSTYRKNACDSHSLSYGLHTEKTFTDRFRGLSPAKNSDNIRSNKDDLIDRSSSNGAPVNGHTKEEFPEQSRWNKVTSSNINRVTRVSPDSQSERISATDSGPPPPQSGTHTPDFRDYLVEYTTIRDIDQRRRYKQTFNDNYAEYKELHGIVEKVSRRFAELEERLKQEDVNSEGYRDLKKQIVKEYQQNKQDTDHQKIKQRFQYLHDKLSHIKRLVLEFDQGVADSQY